MLCVNCTQAPVDTFVEMVRCTENAICFYTSVHWTCPIFADKWKNSEDVNSRKGYFRSGTQASEFKLYLVSIAWRVLFVIGKRVIPQNVFEPLFLLKFLTYRLKSRCAMLKLHDKRKEAVCISLCAPWGCALARRISWGSVSKRWCIVETYVIFYTLPLGTYHVCSTMWSIYRKMLRRRGDIHSATQAHAHPDCHFA